MDLVQRSIDIIKKYQHPTGAYIACPNFENYRYSWLRDGSFIAYAMDTVGEHESAGRFCDWVHRTVLAHEEKLLKLQERYRQRLRVEASDFLPCRYHLDGTEAQDEWPNFQLDGYGTWLWSLMEHVRITGDKTLLVQYGRSIDLIVQYLATFWHVPNSDCWEENPDKVNTSTLACLFGGLNAIKEHCSLELQPTLDEMKAYLLHDAVHEGRFVKYIGSTGIDASLLWLSVPFGVVSPKNPFMLTTVAELESRVVRHGGVRRFPEDTYYGGGEWLLLSAWLGWYYAVVGRLDDARRQLAWVEEHADSEGLMPEQVNDYVNSPVDMSAWVRRWGHVAKPLLWSHGMHLVLREAVRVKSDAELQPRPS